MIRVFFQLQVHLVSLKVQVVTVKASAEKGQSYGDISLLSNNSSSSQSKQTGYQGGLSY